MKTLHPLNCLLLAFAVAAIPGCTAHPQGENDERQSALAAGKPYEKPIEKREIPTLSDHATSRELVRYALLTNADLEQQYWQWRSAIEQVPIDGTAQTTLAISFATTLDNTILPRARQVVMLARTAYQTGNATLLDLLDSERSLIDIQRLSANLQITRDKRLLDIESIDASALSD
jgi:hypothetical protein